MTDVSDAISIAKTAAPSLGAGGRALLVAIGGLESHWGDWWPGTNNWGAVTAGSGWTGATFQHEDSMWTPNGVVHYTTNFRAYPTTLDGAKDLANVLKSQWPKALAAADSGNWLGASTALYDGGYYTGTKPRKQAIAEHYARLRDFLIEQGINPAVIGGAIALEWLFWAGLAFFIVKRNKRRT